MIVAIAAAILGFACVLTLFLVLLLRWAGKRDRGMMPGAYPRSRIPITLVYEAEVDAGPVRGAFEFAAAWWNGVRPGLFAPRGGVGTGDVVPVMSAGDRASDAELDFKGLMATRTTRMADGRLLGVAVRVNMRQALDQSTAVLRRAAAHELGHVLGLAHDDLRSSVMFRAAADGEYGVTDGDVERLGEVYG
jgi:hypothetical protein